MLIEFNKPYRAKNEKKYINQVIECSKTSADGIFTKKCKTKLKELLGSNEIILTTSCSHSIEMAIELIGIQENDEVIVPSYTHPSTANAVLLKKGKVVFTEVNEEDLCINVNKLSEKITNKTKAIIVVHYGGNSCDMDLIMQIADRYNLFVIEDAAQGLMSSYKDKMLGTIGHFGCFSFHETKNISCGEGGALSINIDDKEVIKKAYYIRQKGTNRIDFVSGDVDYYQWVSVGSSYCPSEILMAYLFAQLEEIDIIQKARTDIFNKYYEAFKHIKSNKIKYVSSGNELGDFNAHIFYIIFNDEKWANEFINYLKSYQIAVYTHFVPLHSSKMGQSIGYKCNDFPFENSLSKRLVRLPIYSSMNQNEINFIINKIKEIIED